MYYSYCSYYIIHRSIFSFTDDTCQTNMGKCITAEVSNTIQIIRLWMHTYLHNNLTTLVLQC